MVRLKVPEPPSADCRMANVSLATVPCPDARRTFPPLRQAQPPSALHRPFLPRLREPPSLSGSRCESILDAMMMAGFQDGTLSPRSPRWRPRLLAMMAGNPTGAAFDDLFRLILRGFPGADDFARARAMRAWASTLPAEEAGEVWRAETRFWLQASEPALAVEAAGRMERARPDYRARACRLRTLAYASSGDFAHARESIADGRRSGLPEYERMELLYLEAWMDLQDGRTVQASAALRKKGSAVQYHFPCAAVTVIFCGDGCLIRSPFCRVLYPAYRKDPGPASCQVRILLIESFRFIDRSCSAGHSACSCLRHSLSPPFPLPSSGRR